MTPRCGPLSRIVGPVALLVLGAAGLVLAASSLVDIPGAVLAAAWLLAVIAMVAVAVSAVRESRAARKGLFRTVGHMFGDLGRFVFCFF